MSLPLLKLASLDLVRGFVAVGRRMSITHAAEDLCLTQSAVSRQVAALEARLGVRLFTRGYRAISFTPEGERLFRSADAAVQQLQDAMGELSALGESAPVVLSASIGVTGLWLLPRLSRFQAAHPGIDLRVSASDRVVDLRHDGIDLAIRYARDKAPSPGALRLFGETVAAVAHPSFGAGALRSRQALARLTLLDIDPPRGHLRPAWLQWSTWLTRRGWAAAKPGGVLRFNQYDQVIHAALAGQGVALGRLPLLQPLIDEGRLIVVDAARTETDYAYWLLQADASPREAVRHVAAWIAGEAALVRA
jgi:LysR family transcriptional regulator, glycine cleavage system transcriptional activator